MAGSPAERRTQCQSCGAVGYCIVPQNSRIVTAEREGDGTVRTACAECETNYRVHFQWRG